MTYSFIVTGADKILPQAFARYPCIIQAQNPEAKSYQHQSRFNIKVHDRLIVVLFSNFYPYLLSYITCIITYIIRKREKNENEKNNRNRRYCPDVRVYVRMPETHAFGAGCEYKNNR